ncbi:MAG TPA: helix-turn-helix transcriptional regulator [Isosphaeraceae bacterium]|jgi:transcriptional regulator with XRE-family HTH domain|nr:helix-turn-helix transcriptional regulator [Isosphaeraceae bacterium]
MSLAKRVRDCRYAKGWGPDELASRAEISRTALYQIESGKTELPRAGTLRRIAKALDVSIDVLLGNADVGTFQLSSFAQGGSDPGPQVRSERSAEWKVAEEGSFSRYPRSNEAFGSVEAPEPPPAVLETAQSLNYRTLPRERDLAKKLHELLASPLGEGVARIVEESYRMLPMYQAH